MSENKGKFNKRVSSDTSNNERTINEGKLSENALRESESHLNAALDVAQLGRFDWNIRTDAVVLDERSREIFGFTDGEGKQAQEVFDRIEPNDFVRVFAEVQKSVESGSRLETEYRVNLPDGTKRTIVSISEVICGADGEPERVFGVFSDITDRKNAEEALRQSEERLRLAINISQISTFDIDLLTDEVQTDQIGREIYGWAADEPLTFTKVQNHFHPDDEEYVIQSVAAALEPEGTDGFEVEQRIIRTDGEIRWIRVHGRAFFEGAGESRRAVRCLGTYIDITERKRADKALRRSEQQLRAIYDGTHDYIGLMSPDGILLEANRASLNFADSRREEVVGKPFWETVWFEFTPGAPEFVREAVEKAAAGEFVRWESPILTPDGETMTFDLSLCPIRNENDEVILIVSEGRDVTERKKIEEEISRLSERNQAILESITDAFLAIDRDWRFTYVNWQAGRILDRKPGDLIGKVIWEEYSGLAGSEFEMVYQQAMSEGVASTVTAFYPDHQRWYEVHVYPAANGITIYFRDVTERVIAEENLRQIQAQTERQRRFYDTILSNTPDLVYVFDLNHRFTYANEVLLQMWGKTWDEAIGKNCLELGYEPWHAEMHDREIEQVIATKQPIRGEVPFTGTFGRRIYDYIFVPIIGTDGEVEAVAGTTRDVTERKETEEKIRLSEERYRTLFESIDQGFCVVEVMFDEKNKPIDYCFLEVNPSFENMSGIPNKEALSGKTARQLIPNLEDKWVEIYGKIAQTGESIRFEDDSVAMKRWFGVYAFRVGGEASHKVAILFSDITRQKKAEENLRQSQEVLRLAMSGSSMGAWSRNLATDEVYWSPELEAIFGLPFGTFSGKIGGFYDFVYEEDVEQITLEIRQAIAERRGYVIEFRYYHADGSIRWMEGRGQAVYSADGEPTNVYGIGVDITNRKRAELNAEFLADISDDLVQVSTPAEIVKTIGERLNRFLNISMCAFVEINETEKRATVNYEWHQSDMPGLAGIYSMDEFITDEFQNAAASGKTIAVRDVFQDERILDPQKYVSLGIGAELQVPLIREGQWKYSLCVYHDAAYNWREDEIELMQELSSRIWSRLERAFAEEEREGLLKREHLARLQAEEASRLKDEFLATVSHELRTPLNAILGWSQLLTSGKYDSNYALRAVETIYRNARSQAQLIEDILDVSRIITGKLKINAKPVSLAPIIQSVIESLRPSIEAKHIRLRMGFDFEQRMIHADPDRLQQVVWNLLSNAVKFTPEKGQIVIELESGESEATIVVSDTGKGISPEFLPFVFDRFRQADGSTTRKHGGLGLGLAIVRHIVELHGGTIEVRSEGEGKGTSFRVRLPVSDISSTKIEETNGSNPELSQFNSNEPETTIYQSEFKGLRVLLLDDEKDTLDLIAALLSENGAEVRPESNVHDALETIKVWKPDVIISDIAMPGEDGYSFIKKLRALSPEEGGIIPAIALTAYVGIKERTQVLSSGFQMYVPKPVEPSELLSSLSSVKNIRAGDYFD